MIECDLTFLQYLDDYNLTSQKEMKLVFFMDAIEHVTRIARMIRQDRGNALLVGVGGCGKQSLTRSVGGAALVKKYVVGSEKRALVIRDREDFIQAHRKNKIPVVPFRFENS